MFVSFTVLVTKDGNIRSVWAGPHPVLLPDDDICSNTGHQS
jgi:hypothetical protein